MKVLVFYIQLTQIVCAGKIPISLGCRFLPIWYYSCSQGGESKREKRTATLMLIFLRFLVYQENEVLDNSLVQCHCFPDLDFCCNLM